MRIVSLLPGATETLFALGMGESVVGVSHECDYPEAARQLPRVTRTLLPLGLGLDGGRIDEIVSGAAERGEPVNAVDYDLIRELEPDLVVTQDTCAVCAVPGGDVEAHLPEIYVLRQHPHSLDDVLDGILELGDLCRASLPAQLLVESMRERFAAVSAAAEPVAGVFLEWLDPPYPAGNWTPDLLRLARIEDPLARPGQPSVALSWQQVTAARPELLIVAPCGMREAEAEAEADRMRGQIASTGAARVAVLDGNAYFNRAGPRLADSAELLQEVRSGVRRAAPP